MATVQLALYSVMLLHARVQGFTISPQIPNPIFVKKGEEVTLFCNYTLAGENNNVMSADLYVNGTNDINRVFTFAEIPGSILRQNFSKHLASRSDVFFHNVKSPTNYVAVEIQRAQFSDTGNYTWALNINFGRDQYSGIIETIVGESPERANFSATPINNTTYELQCEVIGGIPVPDIQIRNTSQIILRLPSSSSASLNITVTSTDQYYCTGTNGLGSVTSNYVILPEPETTTSVPPSTSTLGGSDNSSGPAPSFTTTGEKGGSPGPAKDTDIPDNPPNVALIVGVICGCVGGIFIIVVLVCVFKKKTKPGKKVLTLEQRIVEGNDNTCEQQENTTKLSTEQEEEEKQQQNLKGPRGNTKPAGEDGRKKRDAHTNAEDTEELEERQQRNVENLQYADLDLRPRGNTKPTGGDGGNKLVFNDDSTVEYAEVRKV